MPRPNHRHSIIIKTLITFVTLASLVLLTFCNLFPAARTPILTATNTISVTSTSGTSQIVTSTSSINSTSTSSATSSAKQTGTAQITATSGVIYYVATNGSDSNTGTVTSPFRTIAKGVSMLQPGYTLYIKSGKYVQSAPLKISKSGTAASPITISTAPGEPSKAIITGDTNGDGKAETPSTSVYNGLVEIRGTYVTVQNLEVQYSKGRGIMSVGANSTISGNKVHHIWNSGIYIAAAYNLVQGNTIWRTADSNYCGGTAGRQCNGGWPGGLAWGLSHDSTAPGAAPHITIRNNKVYQTSGEGLLCMHTDYGLIEGNEIYDNWAQNVDLDQCSNFTIQKNLIYYSANKTWWKGSTMPASGIMLSNEGIKDSSGNTYPIGHDRIIINNILVGNGSNFHFWAGTGTTNYKLAGSALKNDLIAYNTMVTTGPGASISIDAGPHSNSRIISNLVYNVSSTLVKCGSTSGLTFSQNFWNRTPPTLALSSKDIVGDPLLTDPTHARVGGAVLADWYKIKSTSPAINKALLLSNVTVDYWNTQRSSAPDMGADEVSP